MSVAVKTKDPEPKMLAFESWLPPLLAAVSLLPRTILAQSGGILTVTRQDELMNDGCDTILSVSNLTLRRGHCLAETS